MLHHIIQKKAQLDLYRPFPQSVIQNLNEWFTVELTYTSNAIEGNTLTRAETAMLIEKGLTVGGKPLKDHIEATNHKQALDYICSLIDQNTLRLDDILSIHRLILKGIDDAEAGCLRSVSVRISGSTVIFPNSAKLPKLMETLEAWLRDNDLHPVDKAIQAHYQLVTIHPFVDGNGRTARLLMNLLLMQQGYPPIIVAPKHRLKYINSLEKAQLTGNMDDYVGLMYRLLDTSLNIYLKALDHQRPEQVNVPEDELLKIGELSKATGIVISTLRHWTKIGLLEVERTTPSHYQLFSKEMIPRIQHIVTLKEQRFSLEEILEKLHQSS
jgi:Fic family protein